ncbi:hypothetical protein F4861DRAFT_192744 [Xylaria intraflava]|nr:hypothetical protein F4861DRAFT_192744 [Xylaria intraflava]
MEIAAFCASTTDETIGRICLYIDTREHWLELHCRRDNPRGWLWTILCRAPSPVFYISSATEMSCFCEAYLLFALALYPLYLLFRLRGRGVGGSLNTRNYGSMEGVCYIFIACLFFLDRFTLLGFISLYFLSRLAKGFSFAPDPPFSCSFHISWLYHVDSSSGLMCIIIIVMRYIWEVIRMAGSLSEPASSSKYRLVWREFPREVFIFGTRTICIWARRQTCFFLFILFLFPLWLALGGPMFALCS